MLACTVLRQILLCRMSRVYTIQINTGAASDDRRAQTQNIFGSCETPVYDKIVGMHELWTLECDGQDAAKDTHRF